MVSIERNRLISEARAEAHQVLDLMFDCYEDASRLNVDPEFVRTESATRATQYFWRIYELGVVWAEDVCRGVYRYENYSEIAKLVEPLRDLLPDDDTWLFEEIGRVLEMRSDESDLESLPEIDAIHDLLNGKGIDQKEIQHVMLEMTRARCASTIWSEFAHHEMFHVIFGSESKLFSPVEKRHGQPRKMFSAKLAIVKEVLFRHGSATKKFEARREVGTLVGVSEFTLKNWEAELKKVTQVEYILFCEELAGFWSQKLQEGEGAVELRELLEEDDDVHTVHYGSAISDMIVSSFKRRLGRDVNDLRSSLREARSATTRGQK